MSTEREVVNVGSNTSSIFTKEMSRGERKAKLAAVLERGIVSDRLRVDLPADIYGEWVSDDAVEIARMEALGFKVDTEYAPRRSLHSTGEKAGRVGDVIHMICDRDTHELIEEVRMDQYNRRHGKRNQTEEKEAASQIAQTGLGVIDESKTHSVSGADLAATLKSTIK